MPAIHFTATLQTSDETVRNSERALLLTLANDVSAKLPTRGMVMIEGNINKIRFRAPLEPDGHGTHWFLLDPALCEALGVQSGDEVHLGIEPVKAWPEPPVPDDLSAALAADPQANAAWNDITPMARWDWIRWVDSVKQPETRNARPEKLCSMLRAGKRRPCCFNRTLATTPRRAEAL
jgi:hypothetical protein